MRKLALTLGLLVPALPLLGCSSDAVPAADKSDMPPEVRAEEEEREAALAKHKADLNKRKARGH